jgi:hypothetical protein
MVVALLFAGVTVAPGERAGECPLKRFRHRLAVELRIVNDEC